MRGRVACDSLGTGRQLEGLRGVCNGAQVVSKANPGLAFCTHGLGSKDKIAPVELLRGHQLLNCKRMAALSTEA